MYEIIAPIAAVILAAFIGIVRHQLNQKDEAQARQIEMLFKKHDDDAERLQMLELNVAGHHYQKDEVDRLFDKFKGYLDERFSHIEQILKGKT